MANFLDRLVLEPEDPVLGLARKFQQCTHPQKINLGVGIYQDERGQSKVFDVVRMAEMIVFSEQAPKDYLPIGGDPLYIDLASKAILGELAKEERYGAFQTLGGTQALWLAISLVKKGGLLPLVNFAPTWPNHLLIARSEGVEPVMMPYSQEGFPLQFIETLPHGAHLLLQLACHNPLGKDPKKESWDELFQLMRKKNLYPLFDNAYQGFGTDFEADIQPALQWFREGGEGFMATSFSKNMGLYGERAGLLSFFAKDKEQKNRIASSAHVRLRTSISNPPLHPARIVKTILFREELKKLWLKEVSHIRARLEKMRMQLQEALGKNIDISGKGLFTILPLSEKAIDRLYEEEGIVMMRNGRINISGLHEDNFARVTEVLCREIKRAS